jgi:hypothetical protein
MSAPQPHQPLRMAEQLLPFRRRRDAPAVALEEAHAEQVLELGDAHRDRRLGGVKFFRRAAKAA